MDKSDEQRRFTITRQEQVDPALVLLIGPETEPHGVLVTLLDYFFPGTTTVRGTIVCPTDEAILCSNAETHFEIVRRLAAAWQSRDIS